MRPAQAKEHRGAAPPPVLEPAAGTGEPLDTGQGAHVPDTPGTARPAAADGPRLAAADGPAADGPAACVPAAVGRIPGHVLDERVARARAADEPVGGDVAVEVADPHVPRAREPRR